MTALGPQAQLNIAKTAILTTYEVLSGGYHFPDGTSTSPIENFSSSNRIAKGLVPITDTIPTYDSNYQEKVLASSVIESGAQSVTRTWVIQDQDLDYLKSNKVQMILELHDEKKAEGFTYNAKSYSNEESVIVGIQGMMSSVLDGNSLPSGFAVRAIDGTETTLNVTQFKALHQAMVTYNYSVEKNYYDLVDAINAITTIADGKSPAQQVAEYDITTGWPS